MSEPKFDAGLAWDLSEILDIENVDLPRAKIEGIARKLTEKGYAKKRESAFVASAAYLESVATTLADEFLPAYEAIRKTKFPRTEDR